MPLSELTFIGSINVTPTGCLEVRRDTVILRDGVATGNIEYHRHVLTPGDDLSGEDPRVAVVAASVWTPDVIATQQSPTGAVSHGD